MFVKKATSSTQQSKVLEQNLLNHSSVSWDEVDFPPYHETKNMEKCGPLTHFYFLRIKPIRFKMCLCGWSSEEERLGCSLSALGEDEAWESLCAPSQWESLEHAYRISLLSENRHDFLRQRHFLSVSCKTWVRLSKLASQIWLPRCLLRQHFYENWNNMEKICMALV